MHKENTNQTNTVCRLRRMSTNIKKTSIFFGLSPFDLTFIQPSHVSIQREREREREKKTTAQIFAEEKIHNLPVESDQCLKVHCL